jgi:Cof subfamily protein (haloacid dehalogenase superfamily)
VVELLKKSRFKLLMCDLDGTLVGKGHVIHDADMRALRLAEESGIRVSICTGRSWRESHHLLADMNLPLPGVFSNGAELNEIATGRSIHHTRISPQALEILLAVCRERALGPVMLLHQEHREDPLYLVTDWANLHPATTDWFRRNGVSHLVTESMDEALLQRCLRLGLVMEADPAARFTALLENQLADQFSYHLLRALHFQNAIIEIFSPGVNKWSGILRLCRHLDISPEEVVTIGDDVNDIPMLRHAPMSYAMGGAPDAVRHSARKVTLSHAERGVAAAVADILGLESLPEPAVQGAARYSNFGHANE